MGITLAGVAKGYAVDRAGEVLRQNNIEHALVNAGGDIVAVGGRTDTIPWKIGIRDPKSKTRFVGTVELCDQAIATSGTYRGPSTISLILWKENRSRGFEFDGRCQTGN